MWVAHDTQGSYPRMMTSASCHGAPSSALLQVAKFQVVGTSMLKYWTFQSLTRAIWASQPRGASLVAQPIEPSPCGMWSARTFPLVFRSSIPVSYTHLRAH